MDSIVYFNQFAIFTHTFMGHCHDPSAGGVQKISDLLVVMDGWMDWCLGMGCGGQNVTHCLTFTHPLRVHTRT